MSSGVELRSWMHRRLHTQSRHASTLHLTGDGRYKKCTDRQSSPVPRQAVLYSCDTDNEVLPTTCELYIEYGEFLSISFSFQMILHFPFIREWKSQL
jgi:hypothetical protein